MFGLKFVLYKQVELCLKALKRLRKNFQKKDKKVLVIQKFVLSLHSVILNNGRIIMYLKKGNLYYWNKKVLCEFVGWLDDDKAQFKTTNGGIISVNSDRIGIEITEE